VQSLFPDGAPPLACCGVSTWPSWSAALSLVFWLLRARRKRPRRRCTPENSEKFLSLHARPKLNRSHHNGSD